MPSFSEYARQKKFLATIQGRKLHPQVSSFYSLNNIIINDNDETDFNACNIAEITSESSFVDYCKERQLKVGSRNTTMRSIVYNKKDKCQV